MLSLIVLVYFYLLTFLPAVFEFPVALASFFTFLLYVFRKNERVNTAILFIILLLFLFSSSLKVTDMYIPICEKELTGIYGRVVTEPNRKKNRYTGFSVMTEGVRNRKGDYFSASGKIYVIGPDLSLTRGDLVFLEGVIEDEYFLASGGSIRKKNRWGRAREKFNDAFISSLPGGRRGNIIALLLTGTTIDGDNSISESVRKLGLSHMLSLSGMHLSFISSLVMPLLFMAFEKRKARIIKNIVLFVFVYLAGMRTSLVRSLIFVLLIPFFGIGNSFVLSLVFLLVLFPYYVDEVATVLSFTSLGGILLVSGIIDDMRNIRLPLIPVAGTTVYSSIAATVASAPVVFSIFGAWQPYSFVFSIFGMPLITLLFILTVVRFIIPISDSIIDVILLIIDKSEIFGEYFPLTDSFSVYVPISVVFILFSAVMAALRRRGR